MPDEHIKRLLLTIAFTKTQAHWFRMEYPLSR